jgi:arylsulfatase A-like enzyme
MAAAAVGAAVAAGLAWRGRPAPAEANVPSTRPNVVLISLDTTRADHLGCYGYPKPTSPNLDRLAARGVRYASARAQAPWTLPSHMSLFTSLLPSHCRINALSSILSPDIPTLAQLLQRHGYHTAGLVNDGHMKSIWGFHRGFSRWTEYPVGAPAGKCDHITDEALRWLGAAPAEPFFLFLHYYDPHAPYDCPGAFRARFETPLSSAEIDRIVRRHHSPWQPFRDAELLKQVIGSYDGAIAWLDQELGRLLARLPENTLVVVFSDHGEAFKEHGWCLHGSSLYEEEVHVALLLSMPGVIPEGLVVGDPVMLLDVAPTVLALCGVPAPPHYEGLDLGPTWSGGRLPERPVLSETKAPFDAQAVKMVALNGWKLIRSMLDGREELYRLPDETTNHCPREAHVREALSGLARRWIAEEDFWMLYAHGPGEFTAAVAPRSGQFLNVLPFGKFLETESGSVVADVNGRFFQLKWRPEERTEGLFLQTVPADGAVHFDLSIDGRRSPGQVFLGTKRARPARVPFDLTLEGADASDPVIEKPFVADKPGFYVFRHRSKAGGGLPALAGTLDEQTIRQLRSLGYLR